MEFKGSYMGISMQYGIQDFIVSFKIDDKNKLQEFEDLRNVDKLIISVKKYRKKRSLDANAYAWVLIGKIAEEMNLTNTDVYLKIIRESGIYDVLPVKNEAVDRFIVAWEGNGLGWICETFPSKIDGYTNIRAFYGSSAYNTKEMSRLIDNIVTECHELGIETMEQNELNSLISEWGGKSDKTR